MLSSKRKTIEAQSHAPEAVARCDAHCGSCEKPISGSAGVGDFGILVDVDAVEEWDRSFRIFDHVDLKPATVQRTFASTKLCLPRSASRSSRSTPEAPASQTST